MQSTRAGRMRVVVGSDERTALTDAVTRDLARRGHEVSLVGPLRGENIEWADVGRAVGEAVAAGEADRGVCFCWTGTGVSIAANKVRGVRAALCADAETARGARRWNDANVLVMSLRTTAEAIAREMLDAFFEAEPEASEAQNIAKVTGADAGETLGSGLPRRDVHKENSMATFIMLSTLGPEGMDTLKNRPDRIEAVNEEVEKMGAHVVVQYALLGQYDFLTVLEAPDQKTMARVAVELGARGTLKTLTMSAMTVSEFIEVIKAGGGDG